MCNIENESVENVFAMALQQKLKNKIVGKIFVKCTSTDALYIQITAADGLEYVTHLTNFTDRVLNGLSAEYAAYEVFGDYKKFIMEQIASKYFY